MASHATNFTFTSPNNVTSLPQSPSSFHYSESYGRILIRLLLIADALGQQTSNSTFCFLIWKKNIKVVHIMKYAWRRGTHCSKSQYEITSDIGMGNHSAEKFCDMTSFGRSLHSLTAFLHNLKTSISSGNIVTTCYITNAMCAERYTNHNATCF